VHPLDSLTFGSLHFTGELSIRDMSGKQEVKGKLCFAHANDVVYSKIDARNGAIGIVPETLPRVVFSSEYPIYEVAASVALPDYVKLLFRMDSFRERINSLISGASGRKRVEPTTLEGIEVPLPPLATQQAIVNHWNATQKKNAAALREADDHEAALQVQFIKKLGLNAAVKPATKHAFALRWTEIERWGVDGLRKAAESIDLAKGLYVVSPLAGLVDLVQYGTSEKANTEGRGTAVLRMNNIHEGVLRLHSLKHIELPLKERENLLLKDGDILFNRTNSKELVGKCGVFHEQGEYVYASYLIRVRTKPDVADPDYVAFVMNGPIGRQQIDSMSRQIIGQANVNSQELRSLRIPLPPLPIQKQLVAEVTAARAKIAAERAAAAKLASDTAREVEEMILGHRPVSIP
jgi:type I restriction enzyme S subunit